RGDIRRPLHLVINCRPDRIERNGQMGQLAEQIEPDKIIVIGTPTRSAVAAVPGAWRSRVVDLGGNRPPGELLKEILREVDHTAALVLVGNIHGQGELLLEQIDRLPEVPRSALPGPGVPRQRRRPRPMWHGDGSYADNRSRAVSNPNVLKGVN